ncbi:MAG: hypothetical protein J6X60_07320, partial [Ruminiclostridium sp.]|nr:hypothetical protein [Ruminiclostridium sp.]
MGFLGNTLSSYPKRLLIVLAVAAIVFTVMGFAEVGKDAFGSHRDFRNMTVSDFREGDIINGTITETIGCAATEETTEYALQFIETDKYTSSYYYVIPFYESVESVYPKKIFLYKTGNKKQAQQLEKLLDETIEWYSGNIDAPTTKVRIDRAEITGMTGEERSAFYKYVDDFVDGLFYDRDAQTKEQVRLVYHTAMVPYLVTYNSGSGSILLIIGLSMIGLFALVFIIFVIKNNSRSTSAAGTY